VSGENGFDKAGRSMLGRRVGCMMQPRASGTPLDYLAVRLCVRAIVRHRASSCDAERRPIDDAASARASELLSYPLRLNETARVLRFCRAGIP